LNPYCFLFKIKRLKFRHTTEANRHEPSLALSFIFPPFSNQLRKYLTNKSHRLQTLSAENVLALMTQKLAGYTLSTISAERPVAENFSDKVLLAPANNEPAK